MSSREWRMVLGHTDHRRRVEVMDIMRIIIIIRITLMGMGMDTNTNIMGVGQEVVVLRMGHIAVNLGEEIPRADMKNSRLVIGTGFGLVP